MEDRKKDQETMKVDMNQLKDQVSQILGILKKLRTMDETFPSQRKERTFFYPQRFYLRTHTNPLVGMMKHSAHQQRRVIHVQPFP